MQQRSSIAFEGTERAVCGCVGEVGFSVWCGCWGSKGGEEVVCVGFCEGVEGAGYEGEGEEGVGVEGVDTCGVEVGEDLEEDFGGEGGEC